MTSTSNSAPRTTPKKVNLAFTGLSFRRLTEQPRPGSTRLYGVNSSLSIGMRESSFPTWSGAVFGNRDGHGPEVRPPDLRRPGRAGHAQASHLCGGNVPRALTPRDLRSNSWQHGALRSAVVSRPSRGSLEPLRRFASQDDRAAGAGRTREATGSPRSSPCG